MLSDTCWPAGPKLLNRTEIFVDFWGEPRSHGPRAAMMSPSRTPMNLKRASSSALALRTAPVEPWRQEEWQRLWLSVQAKKWGALRVVPAAAGGPPRFALTIAGTLCAT